jgi:hypothetical protein
MSFHHIFSLGVVAFALVTLQGCASPVTASSAIQPNIPGAGLGPSSHADSPQSPARHARENTTTERASRENHAIRFTRH